MRLRATAIAGITALAVGAGSLQALANVSGRADRAGRAAQVSVQPPSGPAGKHVTVIGSGFAYPCPVYISFTDAGGAVTFLGSAAPSGGAFWAREVIPSTEAVGRGPVVGPPELYEPRDPPLLVPGPVRQTSVHGDGIASAVAQRLSASSSARRTSTFDSA